MVAERFAGDIGDRLHYAGVDEAVVRRVVAA
jgi:hypothetical protein